MKKINLKTVKNYLSRDEMRVISGGSGGGGCYYYTGCPHHCISFVSDMNWQCSTCCIA